MMNMSESTNMARQQYIEWMPQILYNHHQTGPDGTVVAGPPYRDPFNYVYDPLLITGIDALGAAMSSRLNAEGKPGYTMKSGSVYSTWWNGGLRTTAYYHNIIGLLTEIIGDPTPENIPLVPNRLIPNSATPFPITPRRILCVFISRSTRPMPAPTAPGWKRPARNSFSKNPSPMAPCSSCCGILGASRSNSANARNRFRVSNRRKVRKVHAPRTTWLSLCRLLRYSRP